MMPPRGAEARAAQLATLARLSREHFVSPEVGRLLERLRPLEESLDPDSDEACLLRVVRRDFEKASRVPPELAAEMAEASSRGVAAWQEARRASDFQLFRPYLERNLELRRRYVACFEQDGEDYDRCLDDFEPGMTTAEVRAVLGELKEELVPLVAEIAARADAVDGSPLRGPFPIERQRQVEREALRRLGFDRECWRIDETSHPFASSPGLGDVRLTTRHDERTLEGLFAVMHEFGHGLYELGVSPSLARTPLHRGCSSGLHESQSRLWENLVGRSLPFLSGFYPVLQEAFPERLRGVPLEAFYAAVNRVEPSLVRTEADEATYNLHILLRFELEQELLAGTLEPAGLPEAWNARMEAYLGVAVPDDAHGVLQDVHWAAGYIGYFPTYSLGNVISVQIWERLRRDLPDLDGQLERGELGPLREWLRESLHRHGRKFLPKETLARVVGGPLDPKPYLRYLREKLGAIYGLPAESA